MRFISRRIPLPVLDAAAANISILKSPTTLRLEDGTFYGWEGCHPNAGSCEGSCTHVWNYQQALPFLFPALERSMREVDYKYNMNPAGGMSFRLSLPLGTNYNTERPCADGQFGNILKLYRDWKLSGDSEWLKKLWPRAKKTIEYAWSADNIDLWDPEQTGVLWGRQHHTLDMELFGPNSWLTGFYLGALKAGAEMATAVGEPETATLYKSIYEKGRAWVDDNLFNGEYFIQKIDLGDRAVLAPFAATEKAAGVLGDGVETLYWSGEHKELKYQLGDACLIDQVLGQWHASLYGLGEILDADKTLSSLKAIYRHNFTPNLGDIYNPCRVFGLYDEAGHDHRQLAGRREEARRARALRAGDHARHGVRLRADADGLWDARRRQPDHPRRPRPLRRREPQSVERDRVRLQLRPLDGELGRRGRPRRVHLRCRSRAHRLRSESARR